MNSIETEWRKLLNNILYDGLYSVKDGYGIKEILGYHTFISNPLDMTNVLSQKPDDFVEYIRRGYFDIEGYPMSGDGIAQYLEEFQDEKCIRPFKTEDGFVYTYPERLLSMRTYDADFDLNVEVDQLGVIFDRLIDDVGTNRAVATLYNCGLDRNEHDIPCLNWLQATIRDNKLVLHVMFRSNDIYGAWPTNMFFITYIGLLLQQSLSENYPAITFKGIDYHVSSAHIYKTDLNMAKNVLR